jgi:hypothetical protein
MLSVFVFLHTPQWPVILGRTQSLFTHRSNVAPLGAANVRTGRCFEFTVSVPQLRQAVAGESMQDPYSISLHEPVRTTPKPPETDGFVCVD